MRNVHRLATQLLARYVDHIVDGVEHVVHMASEGLGAAELREHSLHSRLDVVLNDPRVWHPIALEDKAPDVLFDSLVEAFLAAASLKSRYIHALSLHNPLWPLQRPPVH